MNDLQINIRYVQRVDLNYGALSYLTRPVTLKIVAHYHDLILTVFVTLLVEKFVKIKQETGMVMTLSFLLLDTPLIFEQVIVEPVSAGRNRNSKVSFLFVANFKIKIRNLTFISSNMCKL